MAKETKTQAQDRLFENYKKTYNAIPDFDSFLDSVSNPKDKKVFTAQTYKNYFYRHFEGSKELLKLLKDDGIKRGDFVIGTVDIFQNTIRGQRYGEKKSEYVTIVEFAKDWKLTKGKTLSNKKTGIDLLRDFTFDAGMWGKCHFFISNEFGNHVRHGDAYLNQFIETAKLRKTYTVTN